MFPKCLDKAVQDDISSKTAPIWSVDLDIDLGSFLNIRIRNHEHGKTMHPDQR